MAAAPAVPLRAVLFDLDDTLVPWQTVAHWQVAWRPRGPPLSDRHVHAVLRKSLHAWDRRRWHGLVGTEPPVTDADYRTFLASTLTGLPDHALPAAESAAVVDRFARAVGEVAAYVDVRSTIDALMARDVAVGATTDLPQEVGRDLLRRVGLSDSLLKEWGRGPDPAPLPTAPGFRRACGELGAKPSETAFVGDLFWSDVRAAARAGLHAILLDRNGWNPAVAGPRITSLRDLDAALTAPPAPSADGSPNGPH